MLWWPVVALHGFLAGVGRHEVQHPRPVAGLAVPVEADSPWAWRSVAGGLCGTFMYLCITYVLPPGVLNRGLAIRPVSSKQMARPDW